MTRPRKAMASLAIPRITTSSDAAYPKHFVGQALRCAFLCGVDHYSGKNYEHRRQWIVDRIRLLSSLFAIDVCACAVMTNHYHLALKLYPEQIEKLSDEDVIERWSALFQSPLLVQRHRDGGGLKQFERSTVPDIVNDWYSKLASINWFMRCLKALFHCKTGKDDRLLTPRALNWPKIAVHSNLLRVYFGEGRPSNLIPLRPDIL